MSGRLDQDREANLQPKRLQGCREKLEALGYEVQQVNHSQLSFQLNGKTINLWPYSGWYSGKGVGSGRGFANLLRALKDN